MRALRDLMDSLEPSFAKGGRLERLFPLYEAIDTFLYTPANVAPAPTHVRDALDLKRMMIVVVIALVPTMLMAMYNTGLQANLAMASLGIEAASGWRGWLLAQLGVGYDAANVLACMLHGLLYWLPIYVVTFAVGISWELLFVIVRKHELNEGFFVTAALFPLIVAPTLPLWQVALGISFGVVLGKEVFGGTGRNWLNPALCGRAFLFFAYPGSFSGDKVWTAVDGYSGATALAEAAAGGMPALEAAVSFWDAFWGFLPGSMGETSIPAVLLGALLLLFTRIGNWRIMLSVLIGALVTSSFFYLLGSETNPMFSVPPHWHLVLGGFAFGTVFMATDPVSAAMTRTGMWLYGLLIGVMVILIRVVNPAFPGGMMLAILFGNALAPLIDYAVLRANTRRRRARYAT